MSSAHDNGPRNDTRAVADQTQSEGKATLPRQAGQVILPVFLNASSRMDFPNQVSRMRGRDSSNRTMLAYLLRGS